MKKILLLISLSILSFSSEKECTKDMSYKFISLKEYIYTMDKVETCFLQSEGSDIKMYFKILNKD